MSKLWQISLLTRWEDIEDPAFVDQWQQIMDDSDNGRCCAIAPLSAATPFPSLLRTHVSCVACPSA